MEQRGEGREGTSGKGLVQMKVTKLGSVLSPLYRKLIGKIKVGNKERILLFIEPEIKKSHESDLPRIVNPGS